MRVLASALVALATGCGGVATGADGGGASCDVQGPPYPMPGLWAIRIESPRSAIGAEYPIPLAMPCARTGNDLRCGSDGYRAGQPLASPGTSPDSGIVLTLRAGATLDVGTTLRGGTDFALTEFVFTDQGVATPIGGRGGWASDRLRLDIAAADGGGAVLRLSGTACHAGSDWSGWMVFNAVPFLAP